MKLPMADAQPKPWTAAKILGVARREMDLMLRALESDARRQGKYSDFHRIWFRSVAYGFAVMRGNTIHATLLDDWGRPTPIHTLTIATDGSGNTNS